LYSPFYTAWESSISLVELKTHSRISTPITTAERDDKDNMGTECIRDHSIGHSHTPLTILEE
jgi:hypothetical protein